MAHLFDINPWVVSTSNLDPTQIRLIESITSIGNGYMGMRGNFEEGYGGDSHLGTYMAGVWYPDPTKVGWWKNGYPHYFGKAINAVNFAGIGLEVNGQALDLFSVPFSDLEISLDMLRGRLTRSFTCEVGGVSLRLHAERFLSIVTPQLSFQRLSIEVVSGEGALRLVPTIDGAVHNLDSNYGEQFWHEVDRSTEPAALSMRTNPNPFGTPQFTVTAAMACAVAGLESEGTRAGKLLVEEPYRASVAAGSVLELVKTVAVVTSRDVDDAEHVSRAAALLDEAAQKGYAEHRAEQESAWADRWAQADVEIDGDAPAQQGIRFNTFQLLSTYYGEDERLNIGPKGFTGEKYGGATYWDTEAVLVPLYLAVSKPDVVLSLLKYRHRQLDQARHNARRQGLAGALYPMVTFDGIECHNEWEITFEEIHRNGAIAHAIANYTSYTGDRTYLVNEGVEVLTEIARFWADRVHFSARSSLYMIHGVTGPNEYENNVNNNWYTNYLARWVLNYTSAVVLELDQERRAQLDVDDTELERWADIAERMYLPEDAELGIKVQHDTFLDKDLMPVSAIDAADRPINQHWSWDRILRSCFIKQADVLQGIYMFEADFSPADIRRNFEFYEPMTVHESSLSPSLHAVLAAAAGLQGKAVELYERSARLDLDNFNNDTEDGLHITSMSGSWLAIVHGFAGMRTGDGALSFSPFCPDRWQRYAFTIRYRGRLLKVEVTREGSGFELVEGDPLTVHVFGRAHEFSTGSPVTVTAPEAGDDL